MPRQIRTDLAGWLGLNLRKDRLSLADEELARSINADLHSMPGVLVLRRGRRALWSTAVPLLLLRRLGRTGTTRYQVAGETLYRNQAAILTGLHTNHVTTFVPARPLNDTTTWTFIADDATMRKDDGSTLRLWGIAAPSTAPASVSQTGYWATATTQTWEETPSYVPTPAYRFTAANSAQSQAFRTAQTTAGWAVTQAWEYQTPTQTGAVLASSPFERAFLSSTTPNLDDDTTPRTGLTGTYGVAYTYVRKAGNAVAHESNPSSTTTTTVSGRVGALRYTVTASSDAQVTHIRCYRTVQGGSTLLYDQEVSNATQTVTTSQADTALGTAVERDNDPPPTCSYAAAHQGHVFLCRYATQPHYLWYSKRYRPEAWPTSQYLPIGDPHDPLQGAVTLGATSGCSRASPNTASWATMCRALRPSNASRGGARRPGRP